LAYLLTSARLIDATCPGDRVKPQFTFERITKGQPSKFRCDLALVSERLGASVVASYDHSVRTGDRAFTDHSAVIVDVRDVSIRVVPVELLAAGQQASGSVPAAKASHKTAIKRSEPSQIASNLVAQGVLKELAAKSILDFGCGYGMDVTFYRQRGFAADGYDLEPKFGWAEVPKRSYDLVTAVYVVNVLPTLEDRLAAVRSAAAKVRPGGRLLLVARSESAIAKEAERGKWGRFNDGWISIPAKGDISKGYPPHRTRLAPRGGRNADLSLSSSMQFRCGLDPGTEKWAPETKLKPVRQGSAIEHRESPGL
jgi:hypothetical protein